MVCIRNIICIRINGSHYYILYACMIYVLCSIASILPFVLMAGLHDVTSYIWSTVHSHFYINLIVLFIFNPYLPVLCLCLSLDSVFYLKLECFGASELLWFFNDISSFLNQFKQFFRGDILLGFWLFLSWIITLFACELFWVSCVKASFWVSKKCLV